MQKEAPPLRKVTHEMQIRVVYFSIAICKRANAEGHAKFCAYSPA